MSIVNNYSEILDYSKEDNNGLPCIIGQKHDSVYYVFGYIVFRGVFGYVFLVLYGVHLPLNKGDTELGYDRDGQRAHYYKRDHCGTNGALAFKHIFTLCIIG